MLVVDDAEELRRVLKRKLESANHSVVCASSGAEALHLSAEHPFDVILLDMVMPHMDGYQTLERLKTAEATRHVPVIMISGNEDSATIARCIERGATDYLPKPFDSIVLQARINACLENKDLRSLETDYIQDVLQIVSAAVDVERGTYAPGSLAHVSHRSDELGTLARVFESMVAGNRQREQTLRKQVDKLRYEIAGVTDVAPAHCDEMPEALRGCAAFASRYTIERTIGSGGMGTVYLAVDKAMGERIAIKTLNPKLLAPDDTEAAMDRFRNEIRLARQISHRNIVRTHDIGSAEGIPFVTMEFVQGTTLRSVLQARGSISVEATLAIGRQLAEALTCAHGEGIIHRDIKPENILIDATGTIKVMDFGIARFVDTASAQTQAGMVVGTPAYMAPEQLLSERVDARSDLYSVGVVLYECITGRLPFEAPSPVALIAKILTAGSLPPNMLKPVSHAVSTMVMRLLAKDASQRPQSASELYDALGTLAE